MHIGARASGALAVKDMHFPFAVSNTPLSNCIHITAIAITELLQSLSSIVICKERWAVKVRSSILSNLQAILWRLYFLGFFPSSLKQLSRTLSQALPCPMTKIKELYCFTEDIRLWANWRDCIHALYYANIDAALAPFEQKQCSKKTSVKGLTDERERTCPTMKYNRR